MKASSVKSVGDSDRNCVDKEPAELSAAEIKRSLLVFAAVIQKGCEVFDHVPEDSLDKGFSQKDGCEIADEHPAQRAEFLARSEDADDGSH